MVCIILGDCVFKSLSSCSNVYSSISQGPNKTKQDAVLFVAVCFSHTSKSMLSSKRSNSQRLSWPSIPELLLVCCLVCCVGIFSLRLPSLTIPHNPFAVPTTCSRSKFRLHSIIMLYSSLFLLTAFELLAQAAESYPQFLTPAQKRQVMSCEQTYGNGSIPCGGEDTTTCFNPGLGQVGKTDDAK